eukprot:gene7609-763_t
MMLRYAKSVGISRPSGCRLTSSDVVIPPALTARATCRNSTKEIRIRTICAAKKKAGKTPAPEPSGDDDSDWDSALTSQFPTGQDNDESEDGEDVMDTSAFDEDDNLETYRDRLGEDDDDVDDDEGPVESEDADEDESDDGVDVDEEPVDQPRLSPKIMEYDEYMRYKEEPAYADIEEVPLEEGDFDEAEEVVEDTGASRRIDTAVTVIEDDDLSLSRQGYQAYDMGDLDLLVSQNDDGHLDLSNTFILDHMTGTYTRPGVSSNNPGVTEVHVGPKAYQALPWTERRSADTVKRKEGLTKPTKIIFVGVLSEQPYLLKLDEVYLFDAMTRSMIIPEVQTVGEEIYDPVLRVRNNIVTIEDSGMAPTPVEMSMGWVEDVDPEREARDEARRLAEREELIEELELRAELDNVDDAPDVGSASDLA